MDWRDISDIQMRIGSVVGEFLMEKDINFAGIDIIGQKLTEINITSPTCAREIFEQSGMNPIEEYFKKLWVHLHQHQEIQVRDP